MRGKRNLKKAGSLFANMSNPHIPSSSTAERTKITPEMSLMSHFVTTLLLFPHMISRRNGQRLQRSIVNVLNIIKIISIVLYT